MSLTSPLYLPDGNVLIARAFELHTHHRAATEWFNTPGLQWALCPFAEAALVRFATDTRVGRGDLSMADATAIIEKLSRHPGFHYHTVTNDWRTLTKPFFKRLHGHKQVTDAYLLGQAVQDGLILVTFDRGIVHVAGEHGKHVHLLESK